MVPPDTRLKRGILPLTSTATMGACSRPGFRRQGGVPASPSHTHTGHAFRACRLSYRGCHFAQRLTLSPAIAIVSTSLHLRGRGSSLTVDRPRGLRVQQGLPPLLHQRQAHGGRLLLSRRPVCHEAEARPAGRREKGGCIGGWRHHRHQLSEPPNSERRTRGVGPNEARAANPLRARGCTRPTAPVWCSDPVCVALLYALICSQ